MLGESLSGKVTPLVGLADEALSLVGKARLPVLKTMVQNNRIVLALYSKPSVKNINCVMPAGRARDNPFVLKCSTSTGTQHYSHNSMLQNPTFYME